MTAPLVWVAKNDDAASRTRADALALPIVLAPPANGFYLRDEPSGLTLHNADAPQPGYGLCLDLRDGEIERRARGGRRAPLARAIGLNRRPAPRVLDMTCGLGRDAGTLAALGCTVHAVERHPALYALLADARARALADDPPAWLARWPELVHAQARELIADPVRAPYDVIYIDPMFDAPRRKARPQKALAWLNELVGVDPDAAPLLELARRHAGRRCVVKQHARAEALAPPDLSFGSKSVRYDVYLTSID